MLYGEGWEMPTPLEPHKAANYKNYWQLTNLAFFNDLFRDGFKGSPLKLTKGYVLGEKIDKELFIHLIKGSCQDEFRFLAPTQSINFVECHDNYTFFDQMKILCKDFSPEEQLDRVRLALSLVVFSQGIPFIHAGEEFLRTKQGVKTRTADDKINGLIGTTSIRRIDPILKRYDCPSKGICALSMTEREQAEKHIKLTKRNQPMRFVSIDFGNRRTAGYRLQFLRKYSILPRW